MAESAPELTAEQTAAIEVCGRGRRNCRVRELRVPLGVVERLDRAWLGLGLG